MLMHCTMDDLIAIRDGESREAASKHLADCGACRAELERLEQRVARLKALPAQRAPRDRWALVREGTQAERRRTNWLRMAWGGVAVAASLVLMLGVQNAMQRQQLVARERQLNDLIQRSQQLDATLQSLNGSQRVWSGREAGAVVQLEDSLTALDSRLARRVQQQPSQDLVNLWKQRVQLMDALVGVHVTRASYVGL
jgi:anti-sigma factor RsiW